MANICKESFFFGEITEINAYDILEKAPEGSFVVRIGTKYPGCFAMNYLGKGKKAKEITIHNENARFSCKKLKDFKTNKLIEVVSKLKEKYPSYIQKAAQGSHLADKYGSYFSKINL